MSFTLIGKHEKDSRANRDGYVEAMLEMMAENPKLMHVDCDLMGCINTGKLLKAFPAQTFNAGIAAMDRAILDGDAQGFIRGNVTIQEILNYHVQFRNQNEFDALMDGDAAFVL